MFGENYDVASAIISVRIDAALTQAELAERSGIDQSEISKMERGLSNPTVQTLRKIAKACNQELRLDFVDPGVNDMPEYLRIRYFEERRKKKIAQAGFKVRRKQRIKAEFDQAGAQTNQTKR